MSSINLFEPTECNEEEVMVVLEQVNNVIKEGVSAGKIGIITMYQAQLSRIRSTLYSIEEGDKILCDTTEQFQGLKKEVIIISTVHCGSYNQDLAHSVGFIQFNNQNNVAVTFT